MSILLYLFLLNQRTTLTQNQSECQSLRVNVCDDTEARPTKVTFMTYIISLADPSTRPWHGSSAIMSALISSHSHVCNILNTRYGIGVENPKVLASWLIKYYMFDK